MKKLNKIAMFCSPLKLLVFTLIFAATYFTWLYYSNLPEEINIPEIKHDYLSDRNHVGEWNMDMAQFKTEGIFKNGTQWEIGTNGGNYFFYADVNGYDSLVLLDGYYEAVRLSLEMSGSGFVYPDYGKK